MKISLNAFICRLFEIQFKLTKLLSLWYWLCKSGSMWRIVNVKSKRSLVILNFDIVLSWILCSVLYLLICCISLYAFLINISSSTTEFYFVSTKQEEHAMNCSSKKVILISFHVAGRFLFKTTSWLGKFNEHHSKKIQQLSTKFWIPLSLYGKLCFYNEQIWVFYIN